MPGLTPPSVSSMHLCIVGMFHQERISECGRVTHLSVSSVLQMFPLFYSGLPDTHIILMSDEEISNQYR
jgi:hypothetical protein